MAFNLGTTLYNSIFLDEQAENIKRDIEDRFNTLIFPFKIHTGFQSVSENGQVPNTASASNYSSFSRTFTGNEGIIAQWRNAIKMTVPKDENGNATLLGYEKEIQKGDCYKGYFEVGTQSVEFSQTPNVGGLGSFTQQTGARTFTVKMTMEFNKDSLFDLYMIPQHFKTTESLQNPWKDEHEWLYIQSVTTYRDNKGAFAYNEVVFASLNNELVQTGKAVWQYVRASAPGESQVIPKLIFEDNNDRPVDYTWDERYLVDVGVRAIQLENMGPNVFYGPTFYGRPIDNKNVFNKKVYATRRLFGYKFNYPIANSLTNQGTPEVVYNLTNIYPDIQTYYENWKENMKAEQVFTVKKNFEGVLLSDFEKTNETNGDNKIFTDPEWVLDSSSKKVLPSNVQVNSNNNFVFKPQGANNQNEYGATIIDQTTLKDLSIINILNFNSLLMQSLITMSLDVTQKTVWQLKDIPGLGGLANKIVFGTPFSWLSTQEGISNAFPVVTNFAGLISKSLYNWYTQTFWSVEPDKNQGILPIDMFRQDTEDEVGGIISSSAINTTMNFQLTDKCRLATFSVSQNKITGHVDTSSIWIGQNDPDDSDIWYIVDTEFTTFASNTITPHKVYPGDYEGNGADYIIDLIGQHSWGKQDVRVTCYSQSPNSFEPSEVTIWEQYIMSQSKYSNKTRDILTYLKVSYLDDYVDDDYNFEWPAAPTDIAPNVAGNVELTGEVISPTDSIFTKWEPDETKTTFRNSGYMANALGLNNPGGVTSTMPLDVLEAVLHNIFGFDLGNTTLEEISESGSANSVLANWQKNATQKKALYGIYNSMKESMSNASILNINKSNTSGEWDINIDGLSKFKEYDLYDFSEQGLTDWSEVVRIYDQILIQGQFNYANKQKNNVGFYLTAYNNDYMGGWVSTLSGSWPSDLGTYDTKGGIVIEINKDKVPDNYKAYFPDLDGDGKSVFWFPTGNIQYTIEKSGVVIGVKKAAGNKFNFLQVASITKKTSNFTIDINSLSAREPDVNYTITDSIYPFKIWHEDLKLKIKYVPLAHFNYSTHEYNKGYYIDVQIQHKWTTPEQLKNTTIKILKY